MIRVLFLNSYEFSRLNADSSYLLTRSIAGELVRGGDWWVDAVFPDTRFGRWTFTHEILPHGVRLLPVRMRRAKTENEVVWEPELLGAVNPWTGSSACYDVVVCNNPVVAHRFLEIRDLRVEVPQTPVVVLDYSTRFYGACELDTENAAVMHSAYSAYVNADQVFFFSRFARERALETARTLLSPVLLERMTKTSTVLPIAFDADRVRRAVSAVVGGKLQKPFPSIYVGGRFTQTKGGETAIGVVDHLFRAGVPLGLWVTSPSRAAMTASANAPTYQHFFTDLTQDEAMRVMAGCAISIFGQSVQMMPAGCFEQIAAGLVVLVSAENHEGILDGYPFLFSSSEECYALLRAAVASYDAAKTRLAGWAERVEDCYSVQTNAASFRASLAAHVQQVRGRFKAGWPSIYDVPVAFVRRNGRVTWRDLLRFLALHPVYREDSGEFLRARYSPQHWRVYSVLASVFETEEENGDPVFVCGR